MSEVDKNYRGLYADLLTLVRYAYSVSSSLAGKEAQGQRQLYADRIFSKIVSHAITLTHTLPAGLEPSKDIPYDRWDVSSACVISRAIIEAFDALSYISIHPLSDGERDFRIRLWELHAEERKLKMLNLLGRPSPKIAEISLAVEEMRNSLTQHPEYQGLPAAVRGKIEKKDAPPLVLTRAELNEINEVSHEYYTGANIYLSSHVHTYPFALNQLMKFRAGEEDSLRLMNIPIGYATSFLAKSIEGMRYIFGSSLPAANMETNAIVIAWCNTAAGIQGGVG